MPNFIDIPVGLKQDSQEQRIHTITDYLSRPVRLSTGVWSTTHAANAELLTIAFPEDLISTTMMQYKMQGFLALRAKVVVRVQINAQRFQQGRLLMHYIPQGQVNVDRTNVIMQSLSLKTQTPRVELDCSTTTSAVIEMPYVSPTTHFNLQTYTGPIGQFHLCVYSPLVSSAASTVDYTVWAHFEDIELSFPTVEFTPQSNLGGNQCSISDKELAQKGSGPISKVLGCVAIAANALKTVPLLSTIAGPVAWAASIGSGVCNAFGWSNPTNSERANRMILHQLSYSQNVNAIDQSNNLGLFADNSVEVLPGFAGQNIDELAFAHVLRIPAFRFTFNWSTSDATNAALAQIPMGCYEVGSTRPVAIDGMGGTATVIDLVPFSYISNLFKYWRGSINITLKFIKTEFHSGRVMVSYLPASTASTTDGDYVYKEILDLRHSNEFTVTIPYVNTYPYSLTTESIGVVNVSVLNPLVCPSTVSSTIAVLVEQSAGPDFELAVPKAPSHVPVIQLPTAGLRGLAKNTYVKTNENDEDVFTPQAFGENEVEQDSSPTTHDNFDPIGSSDIVSGGLSSARFCIGERILSLRQLLKRSSAAIQMINTAATSATIAYTAFNPSAITLPLFVTGSAPAPFINTANFVSMIDYWSYIAPLYAYKRGGMRWKFYDSTQLTTTTSTNTTQKGSWRYRFKATASKTTYEFIGTTSSTYLTIAPQINFINLTGGAEIEVPFYSNTVATLNFFENGPDFIANVSVDSPYRDNTRVEVADSVFSKQKIGLRQAADDTDLGFFIGVMPCIRASNYTYNPSVNW